MMLIVLLKKYQIFLKKWQKDHVKLLRQIRNKKIKRKNPWSDGEIKDLKKTVIDLGG